MFEFADKVGLIIVAKIKVEIAPGLLRLTQHGMQHGLKAHNSGKTFGTDADIPVKKPAQLARADASGGIAFKRKMTALLIDLFQDTPQSVVGGGGVDHQPSHQERLGKIDPFPGRLGGKESGFKFTQPISPYIDTRSRLVHEVLQRQWKEQVKAAWEKAYPEVFHRSRDLEDCRGVGCSYNTESFECCAIDDQIVTAVWHNAIRKW